MTKTNHHGSLTQLRSMLPKSVHEHPSLVSRHYWHGMSARHLTVLYRAAGQRFDPGRDFRVWPHPLQALTRYWHDPDHPAAFYGCKLVLAGERRIQGDGGRPLHQGPGSLLWYHASTGGERVLSESADYLETSLSVDADTGSLLAELGLWRRGWGVADPPLALGIAQEWFAIYSAIEQHHQSHEAILRRMIELWFRIDAHVEHRCAETGHDAFVQRASEQLRRQCGPADRIRDVANAMGVSEQHFRRTFRRATGMSPSAYQLRERLTRAAGLLREHGVAETAALLGYSDPFVFSRQFKKCFGVTPKHFRG